MSELTVRRARVEEEEEQSRPALVDAIIAVLEHDPGRPIRLAEGVFVRAAYLVAATAPQD